MKLAKLLGAGKSFFGGKGSVSYREDKRVYLPKFGATKNPFAPKPVEPGGDEGGAPEKISAPVAVKVATKTQKIYYPPTAPKPVRAIGWADRSLCNTFTASSENSGCTAFIIGSTAGCGARNGFNLSAQPIARVGFGAVGAE